MNYSFEPDEKNRLLAVRETFAARLLTDAQFAEAIAISGIIFWKPARSRAAFTRPRAGVLCCGRLWT